MDRRRFITAGSLMALAVLGTGCAGNPVGGGGDDFIVDINNQWHVDTDADHTFFFQPTTTGEVAAASFTGNEDFAGSESQLSGSFSHEQVSFTVKRGAGDVAFSGTFTDKNTMNLTSNGSSFVLKRG